MAMLTSKLIELEEERRRAEIAKEKGEAQDVGWGSQIRSYVLHPYTMVKDHRTDVEVGNAQGVLDGNLDDFVRAELLRRAGRRSCPGARDRGAGRARALAEDLGAGDLTTAAVVPDGARAERAIEQRAPGVIFGLDVAAEVFRQAGRWRAGVPRRRRGGQSGATVATVAAIEGPAAGILAGERVALNLLGRLSGVATLTARYVAAVEGTGTRILDTRKTTPGLRELEKAAVVAGGGMSHRAGLYDAILVKENHALLAGGVGEAARRALANRGDATFVEVEVESLAELDEVLAAGVDRVLLDDMSLEDMREGTRRAHAAGATTEASGGVSLEGAREVAETGVDFISVGALTHSAPALDLSLLLEPGPQR